MELFENGHDSIVSSSNVRGLTRSRTEVAAAVTRRRPHQQFPDVRCQRDQQGSGHRPEEQIASRAMTDGLDLPRFDLVQPLVDPCHFLAIHGQKVFALGHLSDVPQGLLVERLFAYGGRVSDRDRVDRDAAIAGHLRCLGGRYRAAGVVAVGQGDDGFRRNLALVEQLDAQPDRVAKGRARPRHPHGGFVEQLAAELQIGRERHLQERSRTEYDQTDTVALPLRKKLAQHFLDGRQPIDRLAGRVW